MSHVDSKRVSHLVEYGVLSESRAFGGNALTRVSLSLSLSLQPSRCGLSAKAKHNRVVCERCNVGRVNLTWKRICPLMGSALLHCYIPSLCLFLALQLAIHTQVTSVRLSLLRQSELQCYCITNAWVNSLRREGSKREVWDVCIRMCLPSKRS